VVVYHFHGVWETINKAVYYHGASIYLLQEKALRTYASKKSNTQLLSGLPVNYSSFHPNAEKKRF